MSLGTMLKNSEEHKSGIIVYNDVLKNLEMKIRKNCFRNVLKLPHGSKILVYNASTLIQAEGARLKFDIWFGGDTWFWSIDSFIESNIRLNVNSAFIIKKIYFFPMQVFYRALEARHGKTQLGIG